MYDAGLHKLADEIIRQLSVNYDRKISFKEVLEVIQRDETWFDVLGGDSTIKQHSSISLRYIVFLAFGLSSQVYFRFRRSSDELFPDSQTFQYVTLGPDGNGLINADTLIEMWENVGIHSPKELVHELGFDSRKINIAGTFPVQFTGLISLSTCFLFLKEGTFSCEYCICLVLKLSASAM